MITWFLNLFRRTPKVGEIWLINGPNRKSVEGKVIRVGSDNIRLEVYIFNMEIILPVNATHKEFHKILKIKRISK